jgi:hypothetical protein
VRAVPLLAQGGALPDAEAVLLIDDGEAEAVEVDVRLHECVCADDDVDFAGGDGVVGGGLFGGLERAFE